MLNQKLQQKLFQKLSPQQIQLIKLLEIPSLQLEQRIKKEIEENPILEEGNEDDDTNPEKDQDDSKDDTDEYTDEFTLEDYIEDDETPAYKLSINNFSKDDRKIEMPYSEGNSFHEHLENQLGLRNFNTREYFLAKYIIGSIDEDGYLRRDLAAIADDMAFSTNINADEKEFEKILNVIRDFDPPGTGAYDLRDCLMLQLEKKIKDEPAEKELFSVALEIMENYFNEFVKKHYDKIISRLNISSETLKDVISVITRLNPKPGSIFSSETQKSSQHITPDFILELIDDKPTVSLNSRNIPELRLNKTYSDMLKSHSENKQKPGAEEKNAITFVKQKMDSAKWFIDAIKQRQNTLLLTMEAIVEYQSEYFIEGDETLLKPMILKDIATKTNLDISTISRVANSKYIQTHFGIFPLKYFFSEGMQTQDGEEVSTREIKMILQECIGSENKRRPMTDEKLAKILHEKGYQIARRTVAKYREQLGILVARLRKEL
jgi:RNA polymerase sigma-54 factor